MFDFAFLHMIFIIVLVCRCWNIFLHGSSKNAALFHLCHGVLPQAGLDVLCRWLGWGAGN